MVKDSLQLYKDSKIVQLTYKNFDAKITNATEVWIVQFYYPSCRHSINIVPEFEKLSAEAENEFAVGVVDCREEMSICLNYDIKAYPTIAFLYKYFIIDYQDQQIAQYILKGARKAADDYKEFDKHLPIFNDL